MLKLTVIPVVCVRLSF